MCPTTITIDIILFPIIFLVMYYVYIHINNNNLFLVNVKYFA